MDEKSMAKAIGFEVTMDLLLDSRTKITDELRKTAEVDKLAVSLGAKEPSDCFKDLQNVLLREQLMILEMLEKVQEMEETINKM